MNKLKCSVTTCRHNANNLCELRKIQVDGPAALESRETCCGSYNDNRKCSADCVCVGCCCADPEVVSETECCTFERRA